MHLYIFADFINPRTHVSSRPSPTSLDHHYPTEKALSLAWFIYNSSDDIKEQYYHEVMRKNGSRFLNRIFYDEEKSIGVLWAADMTLSTPLFFTLALKKKILIQHPFSMIISIENDAQRNALKSFITSYSFIFIATVLFQFDETIFGPYNPLLTRFYLYPILSSDITSVVSPIGFSNCGKISSIDVHSSIKRKYKLIAESCEKYFKFLEQNAWHIVPSISTKVLYQSSYDENSVVNLHEEESCFVLISEDTTLHSTYLTMLRQILANQYNIPIYFNFNPEVVDLSSFADISLNNLSRELKNIENLSNAKKMLLSDNFLNWTTNHTELEYIIEVCPKLEYLDLSSNYFFEEEFYNWLFKCMENNSKLVVNVSDMIPPYDGPANERLIIS